MKRMTPVVAALALGAASLVAFAAPSPLQESPEAAACRFIASAATPVAATPAATGEMDAKLAAWYAAPLTDACSGETFTLAQFAPKAVFVHPMATG